MNNLDEAKRLRVRDAVLADDLKEGETDLLCGAPCLAARTMVLTSHPTTAQCYYACQPLTVLGSETEGGPGARTASSMMFFALNLGTTIPPIGTQLLVTFV